MKHIALSLLLAACVCTGSWSTIWAAEVAAPAAGSKPVAVISIASYDRLLADLAMLGDLTGTPELDKSIDSAIELLTGGQGFAGLDKTRPLGIILSTDGTQFQPTFLLPVTNLKTLLESLAGLLGEPEDAGDGVLEVSLLDQTVLIKEVAGYACLVTTPEGIGELPKDPLTLLGGLDKKYDIGARLHLQNLPEAYRTLLVDQLRLGIEAGLARQTDETGIAFEARKKLVTGQVDVLAKSMNEVEQLTIGANLDLKAKTGRIDLAITTVPGSDAGKLLSQIHSAPSNFHGFLLPDAAAALNISASVGRDATNQINAALQTFRLKAVERIDAETRLPDPSAKKLAKEMVGEVFEAVQTTLETGKIDIGATLSLGDKSIAVALGAHVAEPLKLEDALKKFATLMQEDPEFAGIKFNAETYSGVRFHTTRIPVPQKAPVARVLGEKLDVAVGIGDKSVYLALGSDGLKLCKTAIDKSKSEVNKSVPPLEVHVALAPIFRFAAAMQDQPNITAIADELAKSNGKDKVRLTLVTDGPTTTISLEAEEGVLKVIGAAIMASGLTGLFPEE